MWQKKTAESLSVIYLEKRRGLQVLIMAQIKMPIFSKGKAIEPKNKMG